MVKKYLMLIALLTIFSCTSGYPEIETSINEIDPLLTKNESLYVFDEESCSICFDNLLTLSQKKMNSLTMFYMQLLTLNATAIRIHNSGASLMRRKLLQSNI